MPTIPKFGRQRGRRRKGERPTRVYGPEELLAIFECSDTEMLLARMAEAGLRPYVAAGDGYVTDTDYAWPPELKSRGLELFPREKRGSSGR